MKELTPSGRENQQAPPVRNRERMKAFKRRHHDEKRNALFQMVGVDLTTIDGVGVETAEAIVTEYGIDLDRFPTEKQFVAHLY